MALKDDRVEQCLRSCGIEFQLWGPKQENVRNYYDYYYDDDDDNDDDDDVDYHHYRPWHRRAKLLLPSSRPDATESSAQASLPSSFSSVPPSSIS